MANVKSTADSRKSITNIISAIVMFVLLLMMFMPYWQYIEMDKLTATITDTARVSDEVKKMAVTIPEGKEKMKTTDFIVDANSVLRNLKPLKISLTNAQKSMRIATFSINGFTWFPEDQKILKEYFKNETGADLNVNNTVVGPVFLLIFSVVGIVLCLIMPHKAVSHLPGLLAGAIGAFTFITQAPLRLGMLWLPIVALCIVLALVSCYELFMPSIKAIVRFIKAHTKKKAI